MMSRFGVAPAIISPPDLFQRRDGQHMDMPGLGVHRRWRALGDPDDLLDHGPRHRLFLESPHASARLYQRLEFHSVASIPARALCSSCLAHAATITGTLPGKSTLGT
jgi:hypothetical protein